MQVVVTIDPGDPRTLQRQLFDQIRGLILDGKLKGGDPVPASRALSEQLRVSRNTVVLAYELLESEGYIESRRNVGMFVSETLPESAIAACPAAAGRVESPVANGAASGYLSGVASGTVDTWPTVPAIGVPTVISPNRGGLDFDFWVGRADASTFPANEWRRLLEAKVRFGGARLAEYQDAQGLPELRQAIAEHIGPARGVATSAGEIIVVNGSQGGLALIAATLPSRATTFVHEDPCYQGAHHLFASYGFPTWPVPVDAQGIDTARLPQIRRAVLYVTPSHQYPLGSTLSLERRLQLLEWADRTDSLVIEDDYDGDFRYEGATLAALRGLDRSGRVLYLGTFSKSLGAGLRLGFIAAPPALLAPLCRWKALTSNGTPWLEQACMADFMRSGSYVRHLRRIRAIYKARRDVLVGGLRQVFADVELCGKHGGMHLAMRLPSGDAEAFERRAAEAGVGVYTPASGGAFITPGNPRGRDTLLFGFAALPEAAIRIAVERLQGCWSMAGGRAAAGEDEGESAAVQGAGSTR